MIRHVTGIDTTITAITAITITLVFEPPDDGSYPFVVPLIMLLSEFPWLSWPFEF